MKKSKIEYSQNFLFISRDELIKVMENSLSKRRLKHVLRVEKTALKLAEKYDVDYEKVSIAALSHDYAKERPDEEMRDLIISENLDLEMLQYGNNIWHGPIGAVLMKNEYHLEDEDILEAINYHTIGSPKMSLVAKVIYVADFIEPKRSFKGIEIARELADKDLDEAIGYISSHTISHLIKRKNKIYPRAIETYNAWVATGKEENDDSFIY
ncbi:bis(5'-nucleosyl)-tetraphosphatase (symmetrical) YqeK [Alkalibacterium iburiense]|uniref:bis(5'-nucleosyl)-tetraphosphatase (symmetrical) n=1 Tax=Alkalibacterium iburiense TaxID=290589 RepID=A0ABP3HA99_9LACT